MANSNSNVNNLYQSPEDRLDTVLGELSKGFTSQPFTGIELLGRVFGAVKKEFPGGTTTSDYQPVIDHMIETYGIKLRWVTSPDDSFSGWGPEFEVVDEVKFTLFLLKY